jgi:hypothetical protein
MKHYNHSLQYTLALDAISAPLESLVFFPNQLREIGLVFLPESNEHLSEVRFAYSKDEHTVGLTEVNIISAN